MGGRVNGEWEESGRIDRRVACNQTGVWLFVRLLNSDVQSRRAVIFGFSVVRTTGKNYEDVPGYGAMNERRWGGL